MTSSAALTESPAWEPFHEVHQRLDTLIIEAQLSPDSAHREQVILDRRALEDLNATLGRLLGATTRQAREAARVTDALSTPTGTGGLTRWQERRAKEFLSTHSRTDVRVSDVARECGLSRSHFTKAFRLATGETPHRWLQRFRASKAQELLLGSLSIVEIAQECGFADQSHLNRVFKSLMGVPPGLWRRQWRR